ncbi:hypothetical protein EYF80_067502 [Liparis tanakae]|uniref:Uncharacterized protein n=1 Tax=Liparis tanakae TaxID=230148 RepID=A0A4Z2E0X4_9TELE|nr:hypothetical protein EYF80_067502 [Liparis tanakae]
MLLHIALRRSVRREDNSLAVVGVPRSAADLLWASSMFRFGSLPDPNILSPGHASSLQATPLQATPPLSTRCCAHGLQASLQTTAPLSRPRLLSRPHLLSRPRLLSLGHASYLDHASSPDHSSSLQTTPPL